MACDTGDSARNNIRQRLYKSISETEYRVVHLLPGRFLDEIQCVLETRSFGVKTRYEAISYQWGDTSNTKPVLVKAYRVLEAAAKRYIVPLRILSWLPGIWFFYPWFLAAPAEVPSWVPSFIPRDIYMALLSVLVGVKLPDLLLKAIKLVLELAEMEPWSVVNPLRRTCSGKQESERILDFETLQVTTNLELALRYLRREMGARTLWIDALCTYVDRYQRNYHRNLRVGPLFSEEFCFPYGISAPLYLLSRSRILTLKISKITDIIYPESDVHQSPFPSLDLSNCCSNLS
ncbi:hypothetical protein V8E51_019785 [Hyaloscypha variabilis]